MKQFISEGRGETFSLGQRLARVVKPGDVITFSGSMGAGKTVFITGMAQALGCPEGVSSPTFALAHEYPTDPHIVHIDAYRLKDVREFTDAGMAEYLAGDAVCLIEWPEAGIPCLPQERLDILIRGSGDEARTIYMRPMGESWMARLELL